MTLTDPAVYSIIHHPVLAHYVNTEQDIADAKKASLPPIRLWRHTTNVVNAPDDNC